MVRIVLGSKSQLVLSAKTFPSDSCNWPQQLFSALHQGSAISVVDQIKTPAITARHFRYRQVLIELEAGWYGPVRHIHTS